MPLTTEQLLEKFPFQEGFIGRGAWSFSTNTQGQTSVVAEFQAPRSLIVAEREETELAIPAHETFTTDGTAGNTETFTLGYNIIDSPATPAIVLFEAGNRVQPDSVDYAANSFDYTDDGTGHTLDVYYIPRNPATVEFRKKSPRGNIRQELDDFPAALAHTRDQSQNAFEFSLDKSRLQGVVPRKWTLQMLVDAPYPVAFEEDTRGTQATNALLTIPRFQTEAQIEGLPDAVKADLMEYE